MDTTIPSGWECSVFAKMGIDMALLSVIGTFVNTVRDPEWIDGLVQTHRITKGLWYNGKQSL